MAAQEPAVPVRPGPPPLSPERPENAPTSSPRWPGWTAPVALVAALGATLFGGAVIGGISAAAGADIAKPPPAVVIVGTAFQDLAFVFSALLFARIVAPPRPWQFGLVRLGIGRWIGWALATWIFFLVVLAAWSSALGLHQRDDLPAQLGIDRSAVALVAVTVLVTVVAPICEELFFRGYFFTALRSWAGPWLAAVITGAVFGAIHGFSAPVGFLVPLGAFGFGLCLLYWRTGSLYPCMSAHALNNSFALGVTQHWLWWEVVTVMVAANAVIAVIVLSVGRGKGAAPRPAPALS